jgi:anti-anti-sigma factor
MVRIHARKLGDIAVLCIRGEIMVGQTLPLRNKVQSLSDVSAIVFDLAHVTRIDAGGLGVLLELREETQARGIEFRLMNVNRLVAQILEITRLDSVFELSNETELSAARARSEAGVQFCARY